MTQTMFTREKSGDKKVKNCKGKELEIVFFSGLLRGIFNDYHCTKNEVFH